MCKQRNFCKVLRDAHKAGTAIAAINILNYDTTRAVVRAAERVCCPVILQPSMGTVKRFGVKEMASIVNTLRREATVPVILHLDHCTDENLARSCILNGWDSVMVDYSDLSFDENVRFTRRITDFAHINGVAVEGEIGIIAGVEDEVIHSHSCLATLEDTKSYIEKTGIDAVAPAIGTAHGEYSGPPILNYELVSQLSARDVIVVVHGGTGLPEEDFRNLIHAGASKINISTALKQNYLAATKQALEKKCTPIEMDQMVEQICSQEMEQYMRIFAGEAL